MKKKDFILISDVIRDDDYKYRACHGGAIGREHRDRIANIFSEVLAEKNPRFDKERFLKACGVEQK